MLTTLWFILQFDKLNLCGVQDKFSRVLRCGALQSDEPRRLKWEHVRMQWEISRQEHRLSGLLTRIVKHVKSLLFWSRKNVGCVFYRNEPSYAQCCLRQRNSFVRLLSLMRSNALVTMDRSIVFITSRTPTTESKVWTWKVVGNKTCNMAGPSVVTTWRIL